MPRNLSFMGIQQKIFLTADCLIVSEHEIGNKVLLIKRKNEPFKDCWALPGGFVEDNEDLDQAASRELREETGVSLRPSEIRELATFGKPGRDPRGRIVTVVFGAIVDPKYHPIRAGDDSTDAAWWDLEALPTMAFDHEMIVEKCFKRLI
ncbi:MAG: NUDIX hydrolase [Bacteroidota bacterium]